MRAKRLILLKASVHGKLVYYALSDRQLCSSVRCVRPDIQHYFIAGKLPVTLSRYVVTLAAIVGYNHLRSMKNAMYDCNAKIGRGRKHYRKKTCPALQGIRINNMTIGRTLPPQETHAAIYWEWKIPKAAGYTNPDVSTEQMFRYNVIFSTWGISKQPMPTALNFKRKCASVKGITLNTGQSISVSIIIITPLLGGCARNLPFVKHRSD